MGEFLRVDFCWLIFFPKLAFLVFCLEFLARFFKNCNKLPVRLFFKSKPLFFPIYKQCKRWGLHSPNTQIILAELTGNKREKTRKNRAPNKVNFAARISRICKIKINIRKG